MRDRSVTIPGGRTEVGTNTSLLPQDGEGPARQTKLRPFRLGETAVTNAEFADFVAATGYVTEAQRYGWSYVFHLFVPANLPILGNARGTDWWLGVEGASWNRPEGPGSDVQGRHDHPVVHVSWNDATAFAEWAGGRLPTEAEWEHAAKGGRRGATYPWGDLEPNDDKAFYCNIWQGEFPHNNTGLDGFVGTAPARSFSPNGYGLFNMSGNCWEWTADLFRIRSLKRDATSLNAQAIAHKERVLKGGSYLCHRSYCHRYRIAGRIGNTPDSTTGHIGFRMAFDE